MIDLRSDTVTQPTEEMRQAMKDALVGDDVYGDDPTINELEELAANMMGKEAALFVPSGTMGNQLAIMTHTHMGEEMIAASNAHVVVYECGAYARLSGISCSTVDTAKGYISQEDVATHVRDADNNHFPRSTLLCLENPMTNGRVVSLEHMRETYSAAKANNLMVHLDGARIFNAAIAMEVNVQDITAYCDSVMFCLSKGLCAPVGSMLCGSAAFIDKARRNRKILGGGMRQAGVLAACGLVSLNTMVARLPLDHENARYLAEELAKIKGIEVPMEDVETNMVFATIRIPGFDSQRYTDYMLSKGVKVYGALSEETKLYRFVTHHGIGKQEIDRVMVHLREYLQTLSA